MKSCRLLLAYPVKISNNGQFHSVVADLLQYLASYTTAQVEESLSKEFFFQNDCSGREVRCYVQEVLGILYDFLN